MLDSFHTLIPSLFLLLSTPSVSLSWHGQVRQRDEDLIPTQHDLAQCLFTSPYPADCSITLIVDIVPSFLAKFSSIVHLI